MKYLMRGDQVRHVKTNRPCEVVYRWAGVDPALVQGAEIDLVLVSGDGWADWCRSTELEMVKR